MRKRNENSSTREGKIRVFNQLRILAPFKSFASFFPSLWRHVIVFLQRLQPANQSFLESTKPHTRSYQVFRVC
ncbi:hypothetical protein E2C01_046588 [Portunus trituberculatus]|uniref:Uncharacterized protein n=1 Tax=Portunus trituberculatus TaxID=210409 RepID=A0A5B7G1D7_PORTR|nr:hypothetical protein [Portunus trituberculatus]